MTKFKNLLNSLIFIGATVTSAAPKSDLDKALEALKKDAQSKNKTSTKDIEKYKTAVDNEVKKIKKDKNISKLNTSLYDFLDEQLIKKIVPLSEEALTSDNLFSLQNYTTELTTKREAFYIGKYIEEATTIFLNPVTSFLDTRQPWLALFKQAERAEYRDFTGLIYTKALEAIETALQEKIDLSRCDYLVKFLINNKEAQLKKLDLLDRAKKVGTDVTNAINKPRK